MIEEWFHQKGQSLVEVMIALVVVTLVLLSIVSAVLVAMKSAEISRQKSRSTFLANEALEWLRGQRNRYGWAEFAGMASAGGADYCLNTLPQQITTMVPGDCSGQDLLEGTFRRVVTLTVLASQREVTADLAVDWGQIKPGVNTPLTSKISTTFTYWEASE